MEQSKVAVIGLGTIGTIVAGNLVKGNCAVIVADRNIDKAKSLSGKLGSLTEAASIPDAINKADIVVLAIWFSAIPELLSKYAKEFQGKIIVDPSNPIAPDEKGGFKKIIPQEQSAAEVIASHLPKDAKLVKALGTLSAASLTSAAFQQPDRAVLFYATNETLIDEDIKQLIRDSGFTPVRVGNLDSAIRLEVFGDLHEYGALGKTITTKEVDKLLNLKATI